MAWLDWPGQPILPTDGAMFLGVNVRRELSVKRGLDFFLIFLWIFFGAGSYWVGAGFESRIFAVSFSNSIFPASLGRRYFVTSTSQGI